MTAKGEKKIKDSVATTIILSKKEMRELKKLADSHGLSRSAYLRLLIEQNNRTPLRIGA